jgi:hypothetical protein
MIKVEIEWIDAAYNYSTWERDEIKSKFNLVALETTGWLVEERPDCYIIAMEHNVSEDTFRHLCAIPKSGIKKVTKR